MIMRDRIPVCPHRDKLDIDFFLISSLTRLEHFIGKPLVFTSGLRCEECNKLVGGRPNSAHLRGFAVDCFSEDSERRYDILSNAMIIGFKRVGIGKNFLHLDTDISLPQEVMWLY